MSSAPMENRAVPAASAVRRRTSIHPTAMPKKLMAMYRSCNGPTISVSSMVAIWRGSGARIAVRRPVATHSTAHTATLIEVTPMRQDQVIAPALALRSRWWALPSSTHITYWVSGMP